MEKNQAQLGPACEVKRPSEVSQEIGHMAAAIQELDTQLSRLFDRLTPVLRHQLPSTCKQEECEKDQELVQVAGEVRTSRYNIEEFISQVRDTLDRLEI
jgi:chaperonin cofactor prefoldin